MEQKGRTMRARSLISPDEIRTMIRKPVSFPIAICHGNEWQVC